MKEMSRAAGIVGLAALVIGGILYLLQARFGPAVVALLIAGAALVAVFLALNFGLVVGALRKRSTVYGINLAVVTLVVLAILVFIQLIIMNTKAFNRRFDLTEAKVYSLSAQTIKILQSLGQDVKVTGFYREKIDKSEMEDLLENYSRYSPRFTYELLDLDRSPMMSQALDVRRYNTAVVQCGDKKEELSFASPEEQSLTNAVIRVTREGEKVVYFTLGHGEKNTSDTGDDGAANLKNAIEKAAYKVKEIVIARERGGIPAECSALVVAGPKAQFFPFELEQIERYVLEGGRVLLMLDPETAFGLVMLLDKYGVMVGNDYVLDKNPVGQALGISSLFAPLVTDYSPTHEITSEFDLGCVLPLARSVQVKEILEGGVQGEWIARTTDMSWGETNLALLKRGVPATYNPGSDVMGPVPVAVAMTIGTEPSEAAGTSERQGAQPRQARLVAIGDSDMAGNRYGGPASTNFLLNAIAWLVEEEDLISIMPKQRKSSPLILSQEDLDLLFRFPIFLVPGSVILAGGFVYLTRRKHR
jgi:ABC-type uncharacterized transport system involved in gliding motility auxiliary subunit